MRGILRTIAMVCWCAAELAHGQTSAWQRAVESAARERPEARIVVVEIASGKIVAAQRLDEAAHTLAAPGSTLKPLALYQLVSEGRWNPAQRVACNRNLAVNGRRLACSHPQAPAFDASEALTWSCNTYFAAVAQTLTPGELGRLLRPTGVLSATGLKHDEALAEFREPRTQEAEQLTLLGVEGVRITPLELATAYRWLAQELAAHPETEAAQVVSAGLMDSASYGMAQGADLGGVTVMGKTGTAEDTISQTHGWFAGIAPARNPKVVVVVYLPAGRGMDAARVAGEVLAHAPVERK